MRKIILFVAALFFCFMITYAQADKIIGYFLTAEDKSQIWMYRATDGKYYGKLVWIKDKSKREEKDINNPDPKLRDRKRLGMLIIKGLTYNEQDKEWSGGTAYDPENGKSYDCFLWFEGSNFDILYLKGFVLGMRFAGRTTEWKRDKEQRKD